MTLIVGIKCKDGIVMASDGATTSGTLHQESKKLSIINDSVIVGVSGPVGLGQRLVGELKYYCEDRKYEGAHPILVTTQIAELFRVHITAEVTMAQKVLSVDSHAQTSWVTSTIVSIPIQEENHLLCFDRLAAPTQCTPHLPFVAVGSGQWAGDLFLAFLRKLLWPNSYPSLTLGILSAIWTLQHAIHTSPGGVSDPIQVVISTPDRGAFKARELGEDETAEHKQAVASLEKAISEKVLLLQPSPTPPPNPPVS